MVTDGHLRFPWGGDAEVSSSFLIAPTLQHAHNIEDPSHDVGLLFIDDEVLLLILIIPKHTGRRTGSRDERCFF